MKSTCTWCVNGRRSHLRKSKRRMNRNRKATYKHTHIPIDETHGNKERKNTCSCAKRRARIFPDRCSDVGSRMRVHFSGRGSSNLTSAMNKYGREKFVSVILLAGIKEQKKLDSAEIALIGTLITLPGKTGYNIQHGGIIGRDGIMRYNCRAVVIMILDTGSELYFNSFLEAANGMGVSEATIVLLANNNNPYR